MDRAPHRRVPTRLSGYDYASPGSYFVTIVVKDRRQFLGTIETDGTHRLTDAGHMVINAWLDIPRTTEGVECDEMIVMPDHLHGILHLGCDPGATQYVPLPTIVKHFKSITTHFYGEGVRQDGWSPFAGKLWQMNYHDRIVRNADELDAIRSYILDNPRRWATRILESR